jgi:hypothetical protein
MDSASSRIPLGHRTFRRRLLFPGVAQPGAALFALPQKRPAAAASEREQGAAENADNAKDP